MNISRFCNQSAEKELLGCMFKDNSIVIHSINRLNPSDFYITSHQTIFQHITNLSNNNTKIDIVTLAEVLGKNLAAVGGITYLSQLLSSCATIYHYENYIDIVKEKSNMRKIYNSLKATFDIILNDDKGSNEIINMVQNNVLNAIDDKTLSDGNMEKIMEEYITDKENKYNSNPNDPNVSGFKTNIKPLDRVITGLKKQELIIVAARPGMGKTTFSTVLFKNLAVNGNANVTFFSLEMSKYALVDRLVANAGKIDYKSVQDAKLNEEEWAKCGTAADVLAHKNLKLHDDISELKDIRYLCKKRKITDGLDVVVIDYLQLMRTNGEGKFFSREQEVAHISRELKLLAKELNCVVIVLAQLSRAVEQRHDKKPMLSDLRESGSIEQDADKIFFLYRDEYYKPDTDDKNIVEIIVGKNRIGEIGIVKLAWLPKYQAITEIYRGV